MSRLVERTADDQLNHSISKPIGQFLVDEPLRLEHPQEPLVGERLGERRVSYQLPAAHVVGQKDCHTVEEQE